jgi:serine/threonine protein kinase
MKCKIKRTKSLKEMSAMSTGVVQGHAGMKDKQELEEMYSSQGTKGGSVSRQITSKQQDDAHEERMLAQGLRKHLQEADYTDTGAMTPKGPGYVDQLPATATQGSGKTHQVYPDMGDEFLEKEKPLEDHLDQELEDHGIVVKDADGDMLGSGMYGKVYKAYRRKDGLEGAIKIITGSSEDIDRELRNYRATNAARSKDPLIAKHFPEVYMSWKRDILGVGEHGFIFMELLAPVDPSVMRLLPDPSWFHAAKGQKQDRFSKELGQEISKKAEIYLKRRGSVYKFIESEILEMAEAADLGPSNSLYRVSQKNIDRIDRLANPTTTDKDEMKKATDELVSKREAQASKLAQDKNLMDAYDKVEFMVDDHAESPFVQMMLLEIFIALAQVSADRVKNNKLYVQANLQIKTIFERIQRAIRTSGIVKGAYDMKVMGKIGREGASSELEKAIESLMVHAKLLARDLHWKNFLSRPNGDLVIVDLGMFKTSKEIRDRRAAKAAGNIKESRNYRLKILTNRKK